MNILASSKIISLVFATVAVVAFSAPPATANTTFVPASHTLNLTELSSSSLLVSYVDQSGNTISGAFSAAQNTGTDQWTITILSQDIIAGFTLASQSSFWIEPGEPLEANEVSHSIDDPSHLFVSSDESLLSYVGNSLIVADGTPVQFGLDGTVPFFIRFVDQAAQNEAGNGVPDRTSTLTLLILSLVGLLGLRRFRISRLA